MSERTIAIVVTYNPACDPLKLALEALAQQGCDTLLVDNGSNNLTQIKALASNIRSCKINALSSNLGLGVAHNVGIEFAIEHAYNYVLIMDQDSIPLDDMVDKLLAASKVKSKSTKVSAVGVTYLNADNGSESFFVRFGILKFIRRYCADKDIDGCVEADFLISSGSLISLDTISSVGKMDERLFIDHVDTEWFLRAKSKGFQAYGVCGAVMQHGLGEDTHTVSLGGRKRNVPQHRPFRYYYIFRNSILLYKRGYASKLWKWNDVQRLAMIMIMFGFLKAPRWRNLSMMLKGVWHGLSGKQGALEEHTKPRLD